MSDNKTTDKIKSPRSPSDEKVAKIADKFEIKLFSWRRAMDNTLTNGMKVNEEINHIYNSEILQDKYSVISKE